MSQLDLALFLALLGAGAAARQEALSQPPAELLENLDLLDDMPYLEDGADAQ